MASQAVLEALVHERCVARPSESHYHLFTADVISVLVNIMQPAC